MRTTGLRVVPSACAPRPLDARATPTELTIDHSVAVPPAEHPNTTFAVISQSLPPREGLANELAEVTHRLSLCDLDNFRTPSKAPPPKPPRTLKRGENLDAEKEEKTRSVSHPGPPITPTALYELKKLDRKASLRGETGGLSPEGAISSQGGDQIKPCATAPLTSTLSSTPSAAPGSARTRSTSFPTGKTQMAWQSLRRRIFPEDAPSLPSTPPPPTPTPNSVFYPSLSSLSDSGTSVSATSSPQPTAVRPKATQTSTHPNVNAGEPSRTQRPQSHAPPSTSTRPRQLPHPPSPQTEAFEITHTQDGALPRSVSAPGTTNCNPATLDQGPISTISEFESTCKQVFHLQRNARGLMQQNQYSKAAIKYQMALGLIDKVLKSRVLAITPHEATRQRLFHLQEAVFASRKESLNGFTDAQAAVDLPQELSTTAPPPGAPPSYQDVLREDRRRVRGAPPPVPERPLVLNSSMPENGVPSRASQSQSQHRSQQHPRHQRSQPLPNPTAHLPPQTQLSACKQPHTQSQSPGLTRSQLSTQPKQAAAPLPHQPQILANHLPHQQTQPQRQASSSNQPRPQCQAFVPSPASQSEEQSHKYVPSSNQNQNLSQKYETLPTSQPEMLNNGYISPSSQPKRQIPVQIQSNFGQTPPKPKPRTSLPKTQKQPSHHIPQAMQPIKEKDHNNEIEEHNEVKSSQKKNSGFLPHQTQASTQPQIQEEPKQPAYLRNQAQPIGDLIRQASFRGVNPDSINQRPLSKISDKTLVKSQIPRLPSLEDDERKENSNTIEIKPRVPFKISLSRPKSHYHQEKNKEFSLISEEGLYDIPRRRPNFETAHHQTFEKEFNNSDSRRSEKVEIHESSTWKVGTRPRPPKPARRKLQENKSPQDEMNGLHSDKRSGKSSALVTNIYSNLTSELDNSLHSEDKNSSADGFYSQNPLHNSSRVQNTNGVTIPDPFALLDPFPLLTPGSDQSNISFTDQDIDNSSILKAKENCKSTSQTNTQFQAREEGHLQTPIRPVQASCVVLQPIKSGFTSLGNPLSPKNHGNPTNTDLGNSILDALDFAVSTRGSTVSPQLPKDRNYSRCHSEETLLDYSYNTLGRYLESVGSQLDIIDEFDPISSNKSSSDTLAENYITPPPAAADTGSNITLTATEEETMIEESYYAVPRKLTLKSANSTEKKRDQPQEEMKDRRITEDPGNIYHNTKCDEAFNDIFDKDTYVASPYHIYAEVGTRSSVASSSGSVTSWPPEANRQPSSPTPTTPTPSTASTSNQESCGPWSSNNEDSEEEVPEGIGRSSFYHTASSYQGSVDSVASSPPLPEGFPSTSSSSNAWRDLLRIKEGVKIFFIHSDGVITSPWNRPFLSVVRDTARPSHALFLRVGRSLWSCELICKSTLVFKSDASTYLFKETNSKPECTAVAIRVPSTVRKTQHELLWQIMRKNTRIEEERPSGITKSVSKGAASAAVKVNKILEHKESDFNQAFVRRNSIRALKGVSRRLNSLAEKTGNNLPELPEEYRSLRDAANTLRLSRSSRTVQYI